LSKLKVRLQPFLRMCGAILLKRMCNEQVL
jgi:hypothetical protein